MFTRLAYSFAVLLLSICTVLAADFAVNDPTGSENIAKTASFATSGTTQFLDQPVVVKFWLDGDPNILEQSFNTSSGAMDNLWSGNFTPNPTWSLGSSTVALFRQSDMVLADAVGVTIVNGP